MPTNKELEQQIKQQDERIESIETGVGEMLTILKTRPLFEPAEHDPNETGSMEAVEVERTGEQVILESRLTDVDSPEFVSKAASMFFNEEMVTVLIHDTADQHAAPAFDISVNGKTLFFARGEEYTIPRMFVEGLCRAKPVHYENTEYTGTDGVMRSKQDSRRGLRYGFSVVRDTNPLGRAWLKGILAEP